MIVNDKYRFVFVHVPKTAGTSIRKALRQIEGFNPLPTRDVETRHETPTEFISRLDLTPVSPMPSRTANIPVSDYQFFCFVRNPWARFCSLHRFLRGKEKLHTKVPEDINEFARKLADKDQWTMGLHSVRPQVDFATPLMTFVGRYENLAADFSTLSEKLNLTVSLPHENSSGSYKASYRDLLSEASAAMIAEHYENDIREFGYAF